MGDMHGSMDYGGGMEREKAREGEWAGLGWAAAS